MGKLINIFLLCGIATINIFSENYKLIVGITAALGAIFLIYEIKKYKIVTPLMFFILAFLIIVIPEGIFDIPRIISDYGRPNTLIAIQYVHSSFLAFLFGANLVNIAVPNRFRIQHIKPQDQFVPAPLIAFFWISLFLFIYHNIPFIKLVLTGGRFTAFAEQGEVGYSNPLTSGLSVAYSLIMPAIIAYYFKFISKSKHYIFASLSISLIIFIILILKGSRFPILFSVVGYLLVISGPIYLTLKKVLILGLAFPIVLLFSVIITLFRDTPTAVNLAASVITNEDNPIRLLFPIEGVLKYNSMLVDYFQKHDHLYGLSSLTLSIFWIPRSIWPEKPTFLGYWLIREYYGSAAEFTSNHSVDFSFAGDAYADFGFWGLFIVVIIGFIFSIINRWAAIVIRTNTTWIIFASMLYAFAFFSMRSLNTAITVIIGCFCLFYLFRMSVKQKVNVNKTRI